MKKLFLASIAAAGPLTGCATDAGMIDQNFVAANDGVWDTNNDGAFDRTEYTWFGGNSFGLWDANDDNLIDTDEFGAGWNNIGFEDDKGHLARSMTTGTASSTTTSSSAMTSSVSGIRIATAF